MHNGDNMSKKEEIKPIKRTRAPTFQKYYATNVTCGVTSHDIRIEIMNEQLENEEEYTKLIEALIIFSPIGAKKLLNKLTNIVKLYEDENGVIEIKEDKHKY